jgi:hypothetical protein
MVKKISKELKDFYQIIFEKINSKDLRPYSKFVGLCSNLQTYVYSNALDSNVSGRLDREQFKLIKRFLGTKTKEPGFDETYPFGGYKVYNTEQASQEGMYSPYSDRFKYLKWALNIS